jgi:tetratricopeptide (TPR) repeat protein
MTVRVCSPLVGALLVITSCAVWPRQSPSLADASSASAETASPEAHPALSPEVEGYLNELQRHERVFVNPISETEDRRVNLRREELPAEWRHREEARTLSFQAQYLMDQGRWEEAEPLLRRAIAADSSSPSLSAQLAEVLQQEGHWDEAVSALTEALDRQPGFVEGWVQLSEIHAHLRQHDKAVEDLRHACEIQPSNADLRFQLASEQVEVDDKPGALETLRELGRLTDNSVALEDLHVRGLMMRGQLAQGQGLNDEAITSYEGVIALQPRFLPTYLFLGEIHRRAGDTEAALDVYRRGLLQSPTNPDLNLAVRRLFGQEGNEDYLKWWDDFAEENPDNIALQLAHVEILRTANQTDEAIDALESLTAQHPENFDAHLLLGQLLRAAGRNEDALTQFQRATEISPDSPAATENLFSLLREMGQLERARTFIDESISRQSRAQFYRYLAESHVRDGNLSAAEEALREAITLAPDDPQNRFELINLLSDRGEKASALEATLNAIQDLGLTIQIENQTLPLYAYIHAQRESISDATKDRIAQIIGRAVERDGSVSALRTLAEMNYDFGRPERAREALEEAESKDSSPANRVQIIRLYLANGDDDRAESLLSKALADAPDSVELKLWKGIALYRAGEADRARALWSESIAKAEDLTDVLKTLGALRQEGWSDPGLALALTTIRRSKEILPNFNSGPVDLYQFLALFPDAIEQRFDEVEQVLVDAAGESPDAQTWAFLGQFYAAHERKEKAAAAFTAALRAKPDDADWAAALSNLCGEYKYYDVAENLLKEALATHPDSDQLHYYLGFVYNEADRNDEAEAELRRAIELNADNYLALNHLGYMFAEEGRNLQEALSLTQRAVEESDKETSDQFNNGFIVDSLGWVYYRLGQYDEAVHWLQEAVRRAETGRVRDGVFYDHLGDALAADGRKDEAVQAWEQALTLYRSSDQLEDAQKVCEKILDAQPDRPGISALLDQLKEQMAQRSAEQSSAAPQ